MGEFGDGQLTVEAVHQAQTLNQDCPRKPRKPRKKMLHYAPINLMAVTLERGNENPAEAVKDSAARTAPSDPAPFAPRR